MSHSGTIIYMCNVPGFPKLRELFKPLKYIDCDGIEKEIPIGWRWNGSNSEFLGIPNPFFPRFRHPIANCRHDWRCLHAKNKEERLFADKEFKKDVDTTSWKITAEVAYIFVRIGAWFKIGCYY
jgi:hypothetical protein